MTKNITPNRCSMFGSMSTPILTIWGIQNGTKKQPKIDLSAQWPPRGLQGALWEVFWTHLGPHFEPPRG